MSRKMNRRRISPVKIRSVTPPRRVNLNSEVQRIINHAAKLIEEYNKNSIDKILEADQENIVKVEQLLKESKVSLPKISLDVKLEKPKRKRKRNRETKKNQSPAVSDRNTRNNSIEDPDYEYNLQKESYASVKKYISTLSPSSSVVLDKTSDTSMTINAEEQVKISLENSEKEETPSRLSLDKCSSCTICSPNPNSHSVSGENWKGLAEDLKKSFNYEIEIKTAKRENAGTDGKITIILTGEIARTAERIVLNNIDREETEESQLFQTGSLDKFIVTLNEHLGPLLNVKVGLDPDEKDSSWFFEYIRVNDCFSQKDYYFFCHRWLGANSPDNLTQVTLGYTNSLEVDAINILSKSVDETTENPNKSLHLSLNHSDRTFSDAISRENKDTLTEEKPLENNDINEMRNNQKTPDFLEISIEKAIKNNDILLIRQLCTKDKDIINFCNDKGCSPIQLAVIYFQDNDASREIVDYLIALNIDINSKSLDGMSPLHYAVMNDNLPAVIYLLEVCNADPTITDLDGNNALDLSIKNDFSNVRSYLTNFIDEKNENLLNPSSSDEDDTDNAVVNTIHPDFANFRKRTHNSSTETYFSEDESTSEITVEPQIVVELPDKCIIPEVCLSSENEQPVIEQNQKSKELPASNNVVIPEAIISHKVIDASDRKSISNLPDYRLEDAVPANNLNDDLQVNLKSKDAAIPGNMEISKETILPNLTEKEIPVIVAGSSSRKLSNSNKLPVTEKICVSEEVPLPSGSNNLSNNVVHVVDSDINPRRLSNQNEENIIFKKKMYKSEQDVPETDFDESPPILSNSITPDDQKDDMFNDHFETLEQNQLEAENRGIMFHKTISVNDSHNSEEDLKHIINKLSSERQLHQSDPVKIDEKDEEDDTESSQYSSKSTFSILSNRDDDISTITPKSHSEISFSDLENNNNNKNNNKDILLSDVQRSKDLEISTEARLEEESHITNAVEDQKDVLTPLETPGYKIRTVLNRPRRPPFQINRRESENLIKLLILNSILDK